MREALRTIMTPAAIALGGCAVFWIVWRLRKDRAEDAGKWEDLEL